MPYQTPAELAAIRPVDIIDQEMFDDMIGSIPRPVPVEWQDQFRRLNAISRRHGFAWPYERRTRRNRDGKRPWPTIERPSGPARTSRGHVAFKDGREYYRGDDTYLYSAPIASPFDEDGYRTKDAIHAHMGELQ
jgi:hypothetical protein